MSHDDARVATRSPGRTTVDEPEPPVTGAATVAEDAESARLIRAEIRRRRNRTVRLLGSRLLLAVAAIAVWQLLAAFVVSQFYISSPLAVWDRLIDGLTGGTLLGDLGTTLEEAALGLLIGVVCGGLLGLTLGLAKFAGQLLDPFLAALYSLPHVALGPLFILWFGIGPSMKVALAAVITFFMILWNTYAGVRNLDQDLILTTRIMGAGRMYVFRKIAIPGALGSLFIGLRLAMPLAIVGAVVGEMVASNNGIGYQIQLAGTQFDTSLLFSALLLLMIVAWLINVVMGVVERRVLVWRS